ncbi:polysaccharide deacetylase [Paenibacillus sp. 598K]|uniref:polysaccharide deacetylase family protein n=1 Tax=Paenibacillus sp. 598K TaxID=1117987 RepID=UPI000FF9C128|nr:polysaccharide deacetylase family protein [Paenibacillus sp. 598K]GBF75120.1 polysaccharide deacetylase [Paenibacillus sp. 598K]
MTAVPYLCFPEGRLKALTLSYDDGRTQDRRLVELLDRYGLRATFHLNSGKWDHEGYITRAETGTLFKNHEISAHTVNHPFLDRTAPEVWVTEIIEDRRALEEVAGYPVRGMSYPFGTYNDEVARTLPQLGIRYSRTVHSTHSFELPDDPLRWHPTCHHKEMLTMADKFEEPSWSPKASLFYVWGHSYEFDNDNNWEMMETFCQRMGDRDDIWYATNIEILDYMEAARRLQYSVDRTHVFNPSHQPVWIRIGDRKHKLSPGLNALT